MESKSWERQTNIQSPDYFDWVLFDNALMRFLNETTGTGILHSCKQAFVGGSNNFPKVTVCKANVHPGSGHTKIINMFSQLTVE